MNHINKDNLNILNICIEKCEKSIDVCQNLIGICSLRSYEECGEQIGKTVKSCEENINACKKCINFCEEHNKKCHNKECQHMCKKLIEICQDCIVAADRCIAKCREGSQECIIACEEYIQCCNYCAKTCEDFIEMTEK